MLHCALHARAADVCKALHATKQLTKVRKRQQIVHGHAGGACGDERPCMGTQPDVQCSERWCSDTIPQSDRYPPGTDRAAALSDCVRFRLVCARGCLTCSECVHVRRRRGSDLACSQEADAATPAAGTRHSRRHLSTAQHSRYGVWCLLDDALSRLDETLHCAQSCHTCRRLITRCSAAQRGGGLAAPPK